jgi:hypothetical protein
MTDNIDMRFKHTLTKIEMNGKNPFFITLSDDTGGRTKYYGKLFGDTTKFKVIIESTDLSFDAERKYDYKGHLQLNKLYGVNFEPFKNFGLKPGSMIEIYTKDEDFYYIGDPYEDPEAYEAALDEYIYVALPFNVIKGILGVTDRTDDEILEIV